MSAPNMESRVLSRLAYWSWFVSAVGLLASILYGIGSPQLHFFSEMLLGWTLIGLLGIWARVATGYWRAMDAKLTEIESAVQRR